MSKQTYGVDKTFDKEVENITVNLVFAKYNEQPFVLIYDEAFEFVSALDNSKAKELNSIKDKLELDKIYQSKSFKVNDFAKVESMFKYSSVNFLSLDSGMNTYLTTLGSEYDKLAMNKTNGFIKRTNDYSLAPISDIVFESLITRIN